MDDLWLPFTVRSNTDEVMLVLSQTTEGGTLPDEVVACLHVGKTVDRLSDLKLPFKKFFLLLTILPLDASPDLS